MHHGTLHLEGATTHGAGRDPGQPKTRFVHYPDCQQLILWLPGPGCDYSEVRIVDRANGATILQGPVSRWLNGSIQLLFDTLVIAPGSYTLTIAHPTGFWHEAHFVKFAPGITQPAPVPPPTTLDSGHPPVPQDAPRYRDGHGNPVPDIAAELRARCDRDLLGKFTRHLDYEGTFRSGYITYVEGELRIRLLHEMGGGGCKFYIEVPDATRWQAATGVGLERREEILGWIAAAVQRERAASWRYEISADTIAYY